MADKVDAMSKRAEEAYSVIFSMVQFSIQWKLRGFLMRDRMFFIGVSFNPGATLSSRGKEDRTDIEMVPVPFRRKLSTFLDLAVPSVLCAVRVNIRCTHDVRSNLRDNS